MDNALPQGALEGVRIVELAQFVFVPAASAILSDHGAEVIKVEALDGDPYRSLKILDGRQSGNVNFSMEQNNRNKLSLGIDLKSTQGREVFLKLIETADVFLTSIRPDALQRLGVGIDDLRKVHPRLIYARGNGLGFAGPEANRPGFDASIFWARGGFASALGTGHSKPVRQRPALGDHTGSISMAMGIMTALFKRERTGKPSVVEVSLLANAMWVLSSDITQSQSPTYTPAGLEEVEFRVPLTRAYRTSDGRYIQLMFLDPGRYWAALCNALGHPELAHDPRFDSIEKRSAAGRELAAVLDAIFAGKPLAEWQEILRDLDAPWESVRSVHEVLDDPQARANGYVFDVHVAEDVPVRVIAGPVSIDGSPLHVEPRAAPDLGQHTDSILASLGYGPSDLARLRAERIVA